MANTLTDLMPKIVARGLMALRKRVIMPRIVNNDFSVDAAQPGDTINVPIPVAQTASDVTPAATPPTPTNITGVTVPITLDNWKHSDFHLSDKDIGNIMRDKSFIPGQMDESIKALATAVNTDIFAEYKGIYGYTGTAGTTPFASDVTAATQAVKVLNQQQAAKPDRRAVLDFTAEANALALAPFRDASQSSDRDVVIEGEIGRKFGINWFSDDDVPTHTAGTITTGLIAKAATAQAVGDKTIVCTTAASTGACALVEGDIITFAGQTQTYVVTSAATQASASSDVTVNIEPGLVTALAGSEAVTVKATHVVNLAFHRDAFAFATRQMAQSIVEVGNNQILSLPDPKTGLVLRLEVSRQYKQTVWDFDILWGAKLVRRQLATRIAG